MPYDAPPTSDFDPALPDDDEQTLPLDEIIREAIDARTLALRVCLPAKVQAVTGEQKVDVQPLLKVRYTTAADPEDPSIIQNVPVSMPMGAQWSIKCPVAVGDLGLLLFCDRSMDAFLDSDGASTVDPNDARQHHISDPIFIPGLVPFGSQTQDGTTDLVLTNGQAQARILANGKHQLKNGSQELLSLMDQLIQATTSIISAVTTAPFSLPAATGSPVVLSPAVLAALLQANTTLSTIQTNLATLKV